jgi:hypothetical protein
LIKWYASRVLLCYCINNYWVALVCVSVCQWPQIELSKFPIDGGRHKKGGGGGTLYGTPTTYQQVVTADNSAIINQPFNRLRHYHIINLPICHCQCHLLFLVCFRSPLHFLCVMIFEWKQVNITICWCMTNRNTNKDTQINNLNVEVGCF